MVCGSAGAFLDAGAELSRENLRSSTESRGRESAERVRDVVRKDARLAKPGSQREDHTQPEELHGETAEQPNNPKRKKRVYQRTESLTSITRRWDFIMRSHYINP